MKKIIVIPATVFVIFFGVVLIFGQDVSDEAKKHFDRGMAAVEMAKSPNDYAAAINEFEQAARLAPDWPDVYYNLGKVQETAEKFSDAINSFKQYLRLVPDAEDAEEIKSLINKLEYKAIPVLPIAKGFMGIPWGASNEQVNEAMEAQGYRNSAPARGYSFRSDSAGAPFELHLNYETNSFYAAESFATYRSPSPQVAHSLFEKKVNELTKEYGSPSNHKAETYTSSDGRSSSPYEFYEWNPVDQSTSDKYSIKVSYELGGWFSDTEEEEYIVNIHYKAESLYERLINKGTGVNANAQPSQTSQEVSPDQYLLNSSLFFAARDGRKEDAEGDIAAGADINAMYKKNSTPLHAAAANNHKDLVDLLIAKGADINARGSLGWTPLHWAARNGQKEMAEFLIAKGADMNAKDEYGETPLQLAEKNGHKEIVDLLRKHGAK